MATATFKPNSTSSFPISDWKRTGGSSDHDAVTDDSDATYISITANAFIAIKRFGLNYDDSLSGYTIDKIEVMSRSQEQYGDPDEEYYNGLYLSSTYVYSGIIECNSSWTETTSEISRPGGGDWTESDLSTLEVVVKAEPLLLGKEGVYVSQIEVIVTYSESSIETTTEFSSILESLKTEDIDGQILTSYQKRHSNKYSMNFESKSSNYYNLITLLENQKHNDIKISSLIESLNTNNFNNDVLIGTQGWVQPTFVIPFDALSTTAYRKIVLLENLTKIEADNEVLIESGTKTFFDKITLLEFLEKQYVDSQILLENKETNLFNETSNLEYSLKSVSDGYTLVETGINSLPFVSQALVSALNTKDFNGFMPTDWLGINLINMNSRIPVEYLSADIINNTGLLENLQSRLFDEKVLLAPQIKHIINNQALVSTQKFNTNKYGVNFDVQSSDFYKLGVLLEHQKINYIRLISLIEALKTENFDNQSLVSNLSGIRASKESNVEFGRKFVVNEQVLAESGLGLLPFYNSVPYSNLQGINVANIIPVNWNGTIINSFDSKIPVEFLGSVNISEQLPVFHVKSLDIDNKICLSFEGKVNVNNQLLSEWLASQNITEQLLLENQESTDIIPSSVNVESGEKSIISEDLPLDFLKTVSSRNLVNLEWTGGNTIRFLNNLPISWIATIDIDGDINISYSPLINYNLSENIESLESSIPIDKSIPIGHLSSLSSIIENITLEYLGTSNYDSQIQYEMLKDEFFDIQTAFEALKGHVSGKQILTEWVAETRLEFDQSIPFSYRGGIYLPNEILIEATGVTLIPGAKIVAYRKKDGTRSYKVVTGIYKHQICPKGQIRKHDKHRIIEHRSNLGIRKNDY